jgi:hypothetical protein
MAFIIMKMVTFISMKGLHDFHLLQKENEVAFTMVKVVAFT